MAIKQFINVLISSILPCIIFAEDFIAWDKYERYMLSNHRSTLRVSFDLQPLLCSFVWKGDAYYTVQCENSPGEMTNLAQLASFRAVVSEFIIEELYENCCDFRPCLRIKISISNEFFCLDESKSPDRPFFSQCASTNKNQRWKITPVDRLSKKKPARFLIKTSTPSVVSPSISMEGFEMFASSQVTSTSMECGVDQLTQSAVTKSSPTVRYTTRNQTFTNFQVDSTTTYSTDSKTSTGSISLTMPTLPDQEVYPFPDTSASLYATTIYLTKSEAKALPGMTTKLIPKTNSQVTSNSVEYGSNQIARSAVRMSSPTVRPKTRNWIFGNIHNDLTTTYSTVSRTRTELVPTLRSLNGAKFDTNPTGDTSLEVTYSKKATTMKSSISLIHPTSKNQRVNAFPASSVSIYARASYLSKSEAKTLPDGKVSAVGSQDDRKATSMVMNGKNSPAATTAQPIAEDLSVNLMNPWFTVKQCQSTCLQEIDKVFKNCYNKDYVFYNETKIPCNPMPETYQIVAKFMNMFGSMWVVGTSMTSAVLTLAMVPKLFVNQIQCGQDIMLGSSHLMIMFFIFRIDNELMCKITATLLIIFHCIYGNFILLECICVHLSLTNTLNSWNTSLFKFVSCISMFCFTIGILVYLICFSDDLPSDYSCWINYNNHVPKSILTLAGILFSMSMIFIETGISGMHKFLPTMQKKERRVCEISAATLVVKVILSTASFILTSYAVFSQNFTLFPVSFGINIAFGWFNFFAHAICNKKVDALFVKVYCQIKKNLKEIYLYVSRKH